MTINATNANQMREYLKFALEFEKYVYIWSESMTKVNQHMDGIYNSRRQLEALKKDRTDTKNNLSFKNQKSYALKMRESERYAKKAKKTLRFFIIALIVLFVVGFIVGIAVASSLPAELKATWFVGPIALPFAFIIIFSPFLLIGCIPSYIHSKSKASKCKEEASRYADKRSEERQDMILASEQEEIKETLIGLEQAESELSIKQEEILVNLKKAKATLKNIYDVNVLPVKYRNINAVATLYEYLVTRRCDTITGHGGIYDTYETEKIQLAQLEEMVMTNQRLSRMEDNQRYICQELRKANNTLSDINGNLVEIRDYTKDIASTNREIARNTAISAQANRQTADAAQWIAYYS